MSAKQFDITWIDGEREPQVAPNPAYQHGVDIDTSLAGEPSCMTPLPYPARRIGLYRVICRICGLSVAITTAGRPDDPRSLRVRCKQ